MEDLAEPLPRVGPFAEFVGDDVPHAEQHVGHRRDLRVGIHEIGGPAVEVGRSRIAGEDLVGQRLQPPLAGHLGEREFPGFEGEIDVLELLGALGSHDAGLEFGRELPLPVDRAQDRLLAVGELPRPPESRGDPPDVLLVETTGLIAPIPRDERNRVARVEQVRGGLDTGRRQPQPPRDLPQVDDDGGRWRSHPTRGADDRPTAKLSSSAFPGACMPGETGSPERNPRGQSRAARRGLSNTAVAGRLPATPSLPGRRRVFAARGPPSAPPCP